MPFIDVHILQTVPPSNINRDDTGSPKSAVFGGVTRARVSSQAWKRAARTHFNLNIDKSGIGYRTKRIVELVAADIKEAGLDAAEAGPLAEKVIKTLGITVKPPKVKAPKKASGSVATVVESEPTASQSEYLVFLSAGQVARLAALAVAANADGREVTKAEAKAAFKQEHSIDVAMFGRMVADDADLNADAAVQVAHAISVHAVDNEFDYFTAVDDLQAADKQTGAGMIGTVEFNSSTLYRYATINVGQLITNLGDATAAGRAAATFVDAFVRSMPTGKQNTFANRTLPDAVVVTVREDQPVNLVGAFEAPIRRFSDTTVVSAAAKALADYHGDVGAAYGQPSASWVCGPRAATHLATFGTSVALDELVGEIESAVAVSDAVRL